MRATKSRTSSYTRNKSFAVFVSARRKKRLRTDRRTDGRTDRRTDRRTHPLIESWLTTKNAKCNGTQSSISGYVRPSVHLLVRLFVRLLDCPYYSCKNGNKIAIFQMRLSVRLLVHASVDLLIRWSIPPSVTTSWKSDANTEWNQYEVCLTIKSKTITSSKGKKLTRKMHRIDASLFEWRNLCLQKMLSQNDFVAFVLFFFSNYVDVKGRDAKIWSRG